MITLKYIFQFVLLNFALGTCFLLMSFVPPSSQQDWKREMYAQIDLDNFRNQSIFNQTIDFEDMDYALMNACLFFLTNEQRVQRGLPPIKYAAALEVAAWHHSKEMLQSNFFSDINTKNIHRKTKEQRGRLAGISNPFLTENIALRTGMIGQGTYLEVAELFIKHWMESPLHSKNILSDKTVQMGCGLYTDGTNWYATQCFQWFRTINTTTAQDKFP